MFSINYQVYFSALNHMYHMCTTQNKQKVDRYSDGATQTDRERQMDGGGSTWYIHEIVQIGLQRGQTRLDYISIARVRW